MNDGSSMDTAEDVPETRKRGGDTKEDAIGTDDGLPSDTKRHRPSDPEPPADPEYIFSAHLAPELSKLFDQLMVVLGTCCDKVEAEDDDGDARRQALLELLQMALGKHPELAFTFSSDNGQTLLRKGVFHMYYSHESSQILKYLIQANPHAMVMTSLWPWHGSKDDLPTLWEIANEHALLLPWIAERYPWALRDDRPGLLRTNISSPVLELVDLYRCGTVEAADLKKFYTHVPEAISLEGSYSWLEVEGSEHSVECSYSLPLQHILRRLQEEDWGCEDEDLVAYLVDKDPGILALVSEGEGATYPESTPLDMVCYIIDRICSRIDSYEPHSHDEEALSALKEKLQSACRIAHLFVSRKPEMSMAKDAGERQPLDYLAGHIHRPKIQDLVLLMMRHVVSYRDQDLAFLLQNDDFYRLLHDLVDEEHDIFYETFLLKSCMGSDVQCVLSLGKLNESKSNVPFQSNGSAGDCFNSGELAGQIYKAWGRSRLEGNFVSWERVQEVRDRMGALQTAYRK